MFQKPSKTALSFQPVGGVLNEILKKEVVHRYELRHRLEPERGGLITDKEFVQIAERTGGLRL